MFLTDRQQAASVNPTDWIHIVNTASTVTNPSGDSFKAQISQIFDLSEDCCLIGGTFNNGTLTLNNNNGVAFTVGNITFTGGSGNCINNLYVNNIHPCSSNINIQPNSLGKVFFGSLSGASGFTVDLVTDTTPSTRLGLNTNSPEYTFDFYSYDRRSRFFYDDSSSPNLMRVVLSGANDIVPVIGAFSNGSVGLAMSIRGSNNSTYDKVGAQGDTCLFSSTNAKGLNIITQVRADAFPSPDYIRFYAGTSVSGASYQPHIHIDGDGSNRGFMGIGQGNTNPTSLVDISGATGDKQLRLRTAYVPSSSSDTNGQVGQISWGIDGANAYIYIKTSLGWRRFGIGGSWV